MALINYNSNSIPFNNGAATMGFGASFSDVIIDSDNRWSYNGAVITVLYINNSGSILIDGTKVWEVPFSSSSGFVPKLSAIEVSTPVVGQTSGAYGELIGVWNNTSLRPLSADTGNNKSLPSSGWVKLRSKTGNFITGEQIKLSNGSTITASGSGNRSWIQVACNQYYDAASAGVYGTLTVRGDWYYLESTNGQRNQQIKIPVKDMLNGIWVETAPNSNVYDRWLHAGSAFTAKVGNDFVYGTKKINGSVFKCNYDTATITLAYSGVDGMAGFLPPAGCKVRIPNVFLSAAGNGNNLPPNPLNGDGSLDDNIYGAGIWYSRRFTFIGGRCLHYDFDKANINWAIAERHPDNGRYTITNSAVMGKKWWAGARSVTIENSIFTSTEGEPELNFGNASWAHIIISNAKDVDIDGALMTSMSVYSPSRNQPSTNPFDASQQVLNIWSCDNVIIKNILAYQPFVGWGTINISNCAIYSYLENIYSLGGSGLASEGSNNVTFKNCYASQTVNLKNYNSYANAIYINAGTKILIDGFYAIDELHDTIKDVNNISLVAPKQFFFGGKAYDIRVKNVGTQTSPLTSYYAVLDPSLQGNKDMSPCRAGVFNFGDVNKVRISNVHVATQKLITNWVCGGMEQGFLSRDIVLQNVYNYPSILKNDYIRIPDANAFYGGIGIYEDPYMLDCDMKSTMTVYPRYNLHTQTRLYTPGSIWRSNFLDYNNGELRIVVANATDETENNPNVTIYKNPTNRLSPAPFTTINDYIILESPYYILGHTGFENYTESNLYQRIAWGQLSYPLPFSIQFQYDITGNGFNNQWLTMSPQNLSGININPNLGIKLKIKITKLTTDGLFRLTHLQIPTKTDAISLQAQYAAEKNDSGSISNVIVGSRIQLFNETKNTELYNNVYTESNTFTYSYNNDEEISIGDILRARLTYVNGTTAKLRQELKAIALPTGFSFLAEQEDDLIYNQIGINGSTVTEFTADYPNIQVDINDPNQSTSIDRLYAWWVSNEFTQQGIRNYFGGILAEDIANYRIVTDVVDLKLDNSSNVGVIFQGDYRLYRDDDQVPIVASTSGGGSIVLYAGKLNITRVNIPVPGLSPQESATLNKINTLPQDTLNVNLSAITNNNSIGMRLKNSATVSNVSTIITDALSI